MRINHPTNQALYYDVKPSVFSRLDSIMYTCFDEIKVETLKASSFSELILPNDMKSLKRTLKLFVVIPTVGFATTSTIHLLKPVLITADIIIGMSECILCKKRGYSNADIQKIAYRKFIVSPIQQVIFQEVLRGVNAIALCIFLNGNGFWPISYIAARELIKRLPIWLIPNDFSILARSGFLRDSMAIKWENYLEKAVKELPKIEPYELLKEACLNSPSPESLFEVNHIQTPEAIDSRYTELTAMLARSTNRDEDESESEVYYLLILVIKARNELLENKFPRNGLKLTLPSWADPKKLHEFDHFSKTSWNKLKAELSEKIKPTISTKIKSHVFKRSSPEQLFEVSINSTKQEIEKKYRELSLVLHPDKNKSNKQEATELFAIISEAKKFLIDRTRDSLLSALSNI